MTNTYKQSPLVCMLALVLYSRTVFSYNLTQQFADNLVSITKYTEIILEMYSGACTVAHINLLHPLNSSTSTNRTAVQNPDLSLLLFMPI